MILYGAPVKEKIKADILERLKKIGRPLCLAIVQVGDREDSNVYIKQKKKFGEEVGIEVLVRNLKMEIGKEAKIEEELAREIKEINEDKNIDGMIVQLPLPKGFNTHKILHLINPKKDADGLLGTEATGSNNIITSATSRGVLALLDYYEIKTEGKKATVIGQSVLAGRPIADELERRGAEVFRCDINTKNIPEIAKESDILVVAVGKAGLVNKDFVNSKQIIVDVGINTSPLSVPLPLLEAGEGGGQTKPSLLKLKLVGDVNFEEVMPIVSAITPVPGGVGPLTVACLFQNLLDLAEKQVN